MFRLSGKMYLPEKYNSPLKWLY